MINSRRVKSFFLITLAAVFIYSDAAAFTRVRDAMDLYLKDNYISARKKVMSYLDDYPDDELAADMVDMINKTIAGMRLKKGFALISEGVKAEAEKEFRSAAEFHSEYTRMMEKLFSSLLEQFNQNEAANRVIFHLLKEPEPTQNHVYELSRRIRVEFGKLATSKEKEDLLRLRKRVDKLKDNRKWDKAVSVLSDFLVANPKNTDAKIMLSEINRLAAEDFYNQAVEFYTKGKMKKSRSVAEKSRKHDEIWFNGKVAAVVDSAKLHITNKDLESAKKDFELVKTFDPANVQPSLYMNLIAEDTAGFIERTLEMYINGNVYEASARFDYLRLKEPGNMQAKLFFHLSTAKKSIKELKLKEVRDNLIKALEISPDNKEAVMIFERLLDVMEINNNN